MAPPQSPDSQKVRREAETLFEPLWSFWESSPCQLGSKSHSIMPFGSRVHDAALRTSPEKDDEKGRFGLLNSFDAAGGKTTMLLEDAPPITEKAWRRRDGPEMGTPDGAAIWKRRPTTVEALASHRLDTMTLLHHNG
ncbi:hypothetical protein XA68_10359 [Ophiocordyceps unilateralis]|uniref:Uncharacterized protein n=1 Tax=Ophiocordyceps unilateralis TaxID=268505 RepID=A0A2A9P2W4_OPHUN|nr:hypothetical protein XA68_10359 [Ophiocordyceps unilateralis]